MHSSTGFGWLMFSGLFLIWGFVAAVGIAATVFWILEIVDVTRRQFTDPTTKLVWLLVIVLMHFLGAIVYYFAGKPQGWLPGERPDYRA